MPDTGKKKTLLQDLYNLIDRGKEGDGFNWYGELFDVINNYKPNQDTGKLKNLWNECTHNIMMASAPDYPEGDPDGIAEGILVYLEGLKADAREDHSRMRAAELKLGEVMVEVRRAHSVLNGALKPEEDLPPQQRRKFPR